MEGKNSLEKANSFFEEKMVPLVMMEEGETEPMEVMPVALMEGMKALEEEQMLWKPGVKVEELSSCSLRKKQQTTPLQADHVKEALKQLCLTGM